MQANWENNLRFMYNIVSYACVIEEHGGVYSACTINKLTDSYYATDLLIICSHKDHTSAPLNRCKCDVDKICIGFSIQSRYGMIKEENSNISNYTNRCRFLV